MLYTESDSAHYKNEPNNLCEYIQKAWSLMFFFYQRYNQAKKSLKEITTIPILIAVRFYACFYSVIILCTFCLNLIDGVYKFFPVFFIQLSLICGQIFVNNCSAVFTIITIS